MQKKAIKQKPGPKPRLDDLVQAVEHLNKARECLARFFKAKSINGQGRPSRVDWAGTAITHSITYLEKEIKEMGKAEKT